MVIVKICGITNEDDLSAACDAGADMLGFVVGVPSSPRNLSIAAARHLTDRINGSAKSAVVTLFDEPDKLRQLVAEVESDYLQIHGATCQMLAQLGEMTNHSIIAVNGEQNQAGDIAAELSRTFHFILMDSASEEGLGGTGRAHDWNLSREIRRRIHPAHLILAGGLTPENVDEALRVVRPFGVDVSTGVEKKPGTKDHEKMREFIAKAKAEET